MGRLLISNLRTDEMTGPLTRLAPGLRHSVAHQAHRTLWCLRAGDILVFPTQPTPGFVRYLCDTIGVDSSSFHIVVPPPGQWGTDLLYPDRVADEDFVRELRHLVEEEGVDQVLPYHFERTSARLLESVGLAAHAPGYEFFVQGGSEIVNSKAVFRALAAGAGVPIAEGTTVATLAEAEATIWQLLSRYRSLILKQDLEVAGLGNEILSMRDGLPPAGAPRVELVANRAQLTIYLRNRWEWLTQGGRRKLIVERYHAGSVPCYVEMTVHERGTRLEGRGNMRMNPVLNGHAVPGDGAREREFAELIRHAHRLCDVLRAIGYRGPLTVDAIITPEGDVFVSEVNCRQGGSTHLHELGRRFYGTDYLEQAVLNEERKKAFPPLTEFVARLESEGVGYQPATKEGVVVTVGDLDPRQGLGEYCVIARTQKMAADLENAVARIAALADTGGGPGS